MSPLTLTRGNELIDGLTCDNDGKYAALLLELLSGTSSPDSFVSLELQKRLYAMTEDFESSFRRYVSGIHVQEIAAAASS